MKNWYIVQSHSSFENKVAWPTSKETLQGTLMVVAMAIIAALFFLLLDQVLKFLLELLLKIGI